MDERLDVEAALAQAHRLQRVSQQLAEARNPQQVLDAVASSGVEAAGARAGLIALLDPTGRELELVASRGYGDASIREWLRFPVSAELPLANAVRRRAPLFIRSRQERDELFPGLSNRFHEGNALACLPLVVEGRAIGALGLSFEGEEVFDEERRRFKIALAHQVAQALERTRLYQAERELRRRMTFLARAGYLLSSSLDYRETLTQLAQLAVPQLADWCSVDMLSEDGTRIERLAVAHVDPAMVAWAEELGERYPPRMDSEHGVAQLLRTQEPQFVPEISDELLVAATEGAPGALEILRRLRLRSAISVPLVARGRALGGLTLIRSDTDRRYSEDDLELALDLARRAAQAVDNALLFREAQRQADASRALAHVADAVVLLDQRGEIRHWNPAAERLTGLRASDVLGRPAAELIEGWHQLVERVAAGSDAPREALPLPTPAGERWVSVRAIAFDQGVVYALRDVTSERELERVRSDFVATASHELRTPLSAIYGAIRTLRRDDIAMPSEQRAVFLEMIESQAERLRGIVAQLLVAGQVDAGSISMQLQPVAVDDVVKDVVDAARVVAAPSIELEHMVEPKLAILADRDLLRQVLSNLVDNAIKYSPDGGEVQVRAQPSGRSIAITVSDQGLGIPAELQTRIFEKFFRIDPALSRGIGGSGLGLYIANELTRRMGGRLTVSSRLGAGSTFALELPRARSRPARLRPCARR
jgi:PAS domain S-box-containing protein